jgi:uncharacterized protein
LSRPLGAGRRSRRGDAQFATNLRRLLFLGALAAGSDKRRADDQCAAATFIAPPARAVAKVRQTAQQRLRATVVNALSPAYVALLLIHLHFPEAGSLKAKRKELASVKAQLHTRLGVAVSEVDGQDTWQRATLAGALTSGSLKQLQLATDHVEGWLLSRFPDGVRLERSLTSFEDAGGIG